MSSESPSQSPPRTAREVLERGREFLRQKGVESARLEAELLVGHALGLKRLQLFLELERPVSAAELDRARELLVRRGKGEPTAYLTESREFYGRSFRVASGVLIPRPETELLVDLLRERARGLTTPRIADFGTGSGCIAVTAALELQGARVVASDVSARALALARENAERLGADLLFLEGDGPSVLAAAAPFDWIVSNPPYVTPEEEETLAREVREHEPREALFAPAGDPDHWARRLIDETAQWLDPGGGLLLELGHDQAQRVSELCRARARAFSLHADFGGVERVLEVRAPGARSAAGAQSSAAT